MSGRHTLVLLLLGVWGCVHNWQDAPEIEGRLEQGGKALEGIRVTRAAVEWAKDRPGCGGPGAAVVTTDARGHFYFPRLIHRTRMWFPGDPLDNWRLCFDLGAAGTAWWGRSAISHHPKASVSCAPAPGAHALSDHGQGEGVGCTVRDETPPGRWWKTQKTQTH